MDVLDVSAESYVFEVRLAYGEWQASIDHPDGKGASHGVDENVWAAIVLAYGAWRTACRGLYVLPEVQAIATYRAREVIGIN